MIPLESPVPEIGPPGSESGGRKRTHGTRPAARLRKRRISHRPLPATRLSSTLPPSRKRPENALCRDSGSPGGGEARTRPRSFKGWRLTPVTTPDSDRPPREPQPVPRRRQVTAISRATAPATGRGARWSPRPFAAAVRRRAGTAGHATTRRRRATSWRPCPARRQRPTAPDRVDGSSPGHGSIRTTRHRLLPFNMSGCARTCASHRAIWRSSPPVRPRGGYRAGYYSRGLVTRIGKLELRVPRGPRRAVLDRAVRPLSALSTRARRDELLRVLP